MERERTILIININFSFTSLIIITLCSSATWLQYMTLNCNTQYVDAHKLPRSLLGWKHRKHTEFTFHNSWLISSCRYWLYGIGNWKNLFNRYGHAICYQRGKVPLPNINCEKRSIKMEHDWKISTIHIQLRFEGKLIEKVATNKCTGSFLKNSLEKIRLEIFFAVRMILFLSHCPSPWTIVMMIKPEIPEIIPLQRWPLDLKNCCRLFSHKRL